MAGPGRESERDSERDSTESQRDDELFWDVAEQHLATGRLDEGTIMSSTCVRARGEFVAMPEHRAGDLVVKLPASRVADLIDAGVGLSFAPARRVFKEWVQVPDRNRALWDELLAEGIAFADSAADKKRTKHKKPT